MKENQRNTELDILRGIGILFVIFNHIGWGKIVHTYIQSFHMPLFFIVSGFLWKKKELKKRIAVRFKRLLIPYFFFSSIFLFIANANWFSTFSEFSVLKAITAIIFFPTDNNHMPISTALWFLPCLFITDIIYSIIDRIYNSTQKTVFILFISISGSIFSSFSDNMLPFTLEAVFPALLFMLIGEYIRKREIQNILFSKPFFIPIVLFFEAGLSFLNGPVDFRSAKYNFVPLFFINGILGTLTYWGISHQLSNLNTQFSLRIQNGLASIGRYSIVYLCMHQFFILIFKNLLDVEKYGIIYKTIFQGMIFIIVIALCKIITKLFYKSQFRFLLGIQ